jgi:hypothetical protein
MSAISNHLKAAGAPGSLHSLPLSGRGHPLESHPTHGPRRPHSSQPANRIPVVFCDDRYKRRRVVEWSG